MDAAGSVTVVVATMDRAGELDADLHRLCAPDEVAAVVVVDNASGDDTVARVRRHHPKVTVVPLPRNIGAAARTVGARLATTRYVAFADDDSWWDPGALRRAVAVMGSDPRIALVSAAVRVEPGAGDDPVSVAQAGGAYDTDWTRTAQGRRSIAGFLACAVVVERSRFLAAGGFDEMLGIGGEEELVALDLAGAGWAMAYAPEAVVHHHPSPSRDARRRAGRLVRNDVLTALLRLPARDTAGRLRSAAGAVASGRAPVSAVAATARTVRWALAMRSPAPPEVVHRFATI